MTTATTGTTATQTTIDVQAIAAALAAPFDIEDVKFLPGKTVGNRALAFAYVDVRTVEDRLDEVLGIGGWETSYEVLPDARVPAMQKTGRTVKDKDGNDCDEMILGEEVIMGSVICRLRVRIGGEWIEKQDVGSPSQQDDEGDRRKAAFSDAHKRAAVKFGIGRYLYRIKADWYDYDPRKRQFSQTPRLSGTGNGHHANGTNGHNGNGHAVEAKPDPASIITDDQVHFIKRLCQTRKISISRVCDLHHVKSLEQLTLADYEVVTLQVGKLPVVVEEMELVGV